MLSKYFKEEGSTTGVPVVDSLVYVYDGLPVYDAKIGLKGRDGSVVRGEFDKTKGEKKGFWGGLKSLGKALAKDVFLNLAGVEWDAFKKIPGIEELGEWFSKTEVLDLAKVNDEALQDMVKRFRDSGKYENSAELVKAVQDELGRRHADIRNKKLTDEIKERRKELKALRDKIEEARAELETTDEGAWGDAADLELDEQLEAIEEEEQQLDAEEQELGDQTVQDIDDEFMERLNTAVEEVYSEEVEEGDGDGSEDVLGDSDLPFPVLTDLVSVCYGRVDLPKGYYLLTAYGVTPESVEDYTVQWVIEAVIDRKAYKSYCDLVLRGDASPEEIDDAAALVEVSTVETEELGTDFMSYVIHNETSGDFEATFGFMPSRDMPNSFIAGVNSTNNAFTIFTSAALEATMIPVLGVSEEASEEASATELESEGVSPV